jgi:hypothetical protein
METGALPTQNATTWLREHAHNLLPLIGLLVLLQAPITALFVANNIPGLSIVDLVFGALGGGVTAYSKYVDSKAFTTIQVANATAAANQYLPPNVQHVLGTLSDFHDQVGQLLTQMQQTQQPTPATEPARPVPQPAPLSPATGSTV